MILYEFEKSHKCEKTSFFSFFFEKNKLKVPLLNLTSLESKQIAWKSVNENHDLATKLAKRKIITNYHEIVLVVRTVIRQCWCINVGCHILMSLGCDVITITFLPLTVSSLLCPHRKWKFWVMQNNHCQSEHICHLIYRYSTWNVLFDQWSFTVGVATQCDASLHRTWLAHSVSFTFALRLLEDT